MLCGFQGAAAFAAVLSLLCCLHDSDILIVNDFSGKVNRNIVFSIFSSFYIIHPEKEGVFIVYSSQETFARIKYVLSKKRIRQSKMLHDLQLNNCILSQSANSQNGLTAKNLYAIAEYLQVSADYLLGLSDKVEL